jgi:hypothetical protein
MFWEIEKMANYTQHLLYNPDEAEALGMTQRNRLIETQHAMTKIHVLENHYDIQVGESQTVIGLKI